MKVKKKETNKKNQRKKERKNNCISSYMFDVISFLFIFYLFAEALFVE